MKRSGYFILGFIAFVIILNAIHNNQTMSVKGVNSTPVLTETPSIVPTIKTTANYAQSVVHVECDNGYGGSGTILTKNGLIVTNDHVITGSNTCYVTIPDPTTGSPVSIYTAQPLIAPNLSQLYDIAVLYITGSYTDSNRKIWGVYPTTFPTFVNTASCYNTTPRLGDPIRVYGYPVTSGGYNLTVTDGIISSFANNGDILTSTKVDSGNSGGLAINPQTGCMVGIPSAVNAGNFQNLGVIIPTNVLVDYLEKAKAQANNPNQGQYIQTQANQQTTSSEQTIDCTGPDGKHLQITQKQCDEFNAAWNNVPQSIDPWGEDSQVNECAKTNNYALCKCVGDYMYKTYTEDQVKQFEISNSYPQDVKTEANYCKQNTQN